MVTAAVATMAMKGAKTGRKYTLSLHFAGNEAIGAYVLVDWNSPAAATSPNFFTVPELLDVIDLVIPAAITAGQVEFTSDGQRTAVVFDVTTFYASINQRPVGILPRLQSGKAYRFLVVNTVTS